MTYFTEMTYISDQGIKIKAKDLRLTLVTFLNFLVVKFSLENFSN